MKRSLAAVVSVVLTCVIGGAPARAAAGPPVVLPTGSAVRWHTNPSWMKIHLRIANASRVSVQMTGYVFGSKPTPGIHFYKQTGRFPLTRGHGDVWSATRRGNAAVDAAMSDQSTIAIRACNAEGCVNTTLVHRDVE